MEKQKTSARGEKGMYKLTDLLFGSNALVKNNGTNDSKIAKPAVIYEK